MTKLERILYTSAPVSFVRESTRKIVLPGFYGVPLYHVFKRFQHQIKSVGLNERAAAISFNFIMAIPAATIFLFTLVPYLPVAKGVFKEIVRFVSDITPNAQTRLLVLDFLDDFFNKPKNGMLSIGFVLAVYYSSNAMLGIIRTFDRSLLIKEKTNFILRRFKAIQLTTIVIFILIGTSLISLGQGELLKSLLKMAHIKNVQVRWWIQNLRWLLIILLFFYSIAFMYKYAPTIHKAKRWKLNSPGAILATVLIIIVTWVFAIWAKNFSTYNKVYGSIGTVLLLMFLIYLNSIILLIGFELNVSIFHLGVAEKDLPHLKERIQMKE